MINFIYKYSINLCVFWALIIFALCATPGQYIPSANWLELLSFDKFVHAGMFFVLTCLGFISLIKAQKSNGLIILFLLLCVGYGALLELMQAFCFSNRSADWKDIVANSFGCIVALLFSKKMRRFSELHNIDNLQP